ncbi:hypothetical protein K701_11280 [Streptomyces fradiae ATCC 10745 = DSM 40063]|uniref:Uncharacterized protein n=2 Tax=Streptomyces TaxID=1883 RepID=A0A1D8FWA2_9ACTN|nr:hypothetical protein A4G23_00278 [Streptomyces rubrolavendulae]KAF0649969.1 hypothetical protein K701_11280 [Streptomyces fradiae ATCC 10745 = DSM 40063]QEV10894.1 hypothetical protein CP974_01465 [Streptomyces fradiae ATCC 10745 = DSM 40063]
MDQRALVAARRRRYGRVVDVPGPPAGTGHAPRADGAADEDTSPGRRPPRRAAATTAPADRPDRPPRPPAAPAPPAAG